MKAVFINNSGVMHMTQGKAYEVIEEIESVNDRIGRGKEFYILPFYKIINDDGKQIWHQKYMFMPLEEWREQQLNKILID
jgi:hypothetical protein